MKITKVLITGSSGFIGSCLIDYLINYAHISTSNIDITDLIPNRQHTKCNFVDPYSALKDVHKYSHIIHLGAQSSTNNTDKLRIYNDNIKYTTTLLEQLPSHTTFINASSASVYKPHDYAITETCDNEQPNSLYSFSKCHIDNLIRNIFYDKKILSLRFFNVCSFFSENHKTQPSPTFVFLKSISMSGTVQLFHQSQSIYRDFIYITDVLHIIYHLMNIEILGSDIINVGCGQPVSFYDIASTFIAKYPDTKITYIDKPKDLTAAYQYYTHANIDKLRKYNYTTQIPSIIDHIHTYVQSRNITNYQLY